MFTGIITDIGTVKELEKRGDLRARIGTGYDTSAIDIGASIACDGVCLTVIALGGDWFDVEISAETVSKTNLAAWTEGRRINLERALKVGDELGGHIVSGHVDGVARARLRCTEEGDSTRMVSPSEAPGRTGQIHRAQRLGHVERHLTDRERSGWLRPFGINVIPHTKDGDDLGSWRKVGDAASTWKLTRWRVTLPVCAISPDPT